MRTRQGQMEVHGPPNLLFRPHPLLGWALTPDSMVRVKFRNGITQHVGSDGWRVVPNQPDRGVRVNLYGCSWTFGTGLADDETAAAQLQAAHRDIIVGNRGCGGYGTIHNYIQMRRDIAAGNVDIAVFLVISDHRFRNTPHPRRWKNLQAPRWKKQRISQVPVARQARDGSFEVDYVSPTQPAVDATGLDAFLPSDFMLDQATLATLDAALSLARDNNVKTLVAVLDSVDPQFNNALFKRFDRAIDASVPFDEDHFLLPHDNHPNIQANRIFAGKLSQALPGLL